MPRHGAPTGRALPAQVGTRGPHVKGAGHACGRLTPPSGTPGMPRTLYETRPTLRYHGQPLEEIANHANSSAVLPSPPLNPSQGIQGRLPFLGIDDDRWRTGW